MIKNISTQDQLLVPVGKKGLQDNLVLIRPKNFFRAMHLPICQAFLWGLLLLSLAPAQVWGEICYQALYPMVIGGSELTTDIVSLDYDKSFNLVVGGRSTDSNFLADSTNHYPFVTYIDKQGRVKWSKEFVKPTYISQRVDDVDFNYDETEIVIVLDPGHAFFISRLSAKDGSVISAHMANEGELYGSYMNYGVQTLIDKDGSIYSTFGKLNDCNIIKFEIGSPFDEIDLDWNLEFFCYSLGGFKPSSLESVDESDRLYVGGFSNQGSQYYPALGLVDKDTGELQWMAYHTYYQDDSRISEPEYHSPFKYTNNRLSIQNSDQLDQVMGCSSPRGYGQFVIVQKALIVGKELVSLDSYYLDYEVLFRNPGGQCKAIHSSDGNDVSMLFSGAMAQQQFVLFRVDLEEMKAFVQEVTSFNYNYTKINQGIFLSHDLLFYAGYAQEFKGLNTNTESIFSYVMSFSQYQSFLDFDYEEEELAIFSQSSYTMEDEDSLYTYGANFELHTVLDLTTTDTKTSNNIIQIETGYFIYPNSIDSSIADQAYIVGSGLQEKEVPLVRNKDCGISTKYFSYLSDGKDLPAFITFNPSLGKYVIESYSNKDTGSYEIVFGEQLQTDRDVIDDSLMWTLAVLPYNPYIIHEDVSPPYFVQPLQVIVVQQEDIYEGQLPEYTSDHGNEVELDINMNDARRFVYFSDKDREIIVIPSNKELGTYLLDIVLKDKGLGLDSEVYVLNVTVTEKIIEEEPEPEPEPQEDPPVSQEDSIENRIKENMEIYNSSEKTLIAEIEKINQAGEMIVRFSSELKTPTNMTEFRLSINDLIDITVVQKNKDTQELVPVNFEWSFTSMEKDEIIFQLTFEDSLSLKSNDTWIICGIIEFKDRYYFSSDTDPPTFLGEASAELVGIVPDQFKNDAASKILAEYGESVATSINVFVYANLGAQLVLSSSLSFVWGMINVLQLIVHLPLLQQDMPSNSLFFFQLLFNMTNFNLIPLESISEKIFDFHESEPFSTRFEQFDYSTLSLISNLGGIFYYMVGLLGLFLLLKLLTVTSRRHGRVAKYVYNKLLAILTPGFYLRFFMECYLELSLCAFLGLYEISMDSPSYVFNSIINVVTVMISVGLPLGLGLFVLYKTKRLQEEDYFKQYISLFEFLKVVHPVHTSYVFLFILRRLLFTLTAIYMQTFKMSLFFLQSLLLGAYLIYFMPFITKKFNYIEVLNEQTITLVALLFLMCDQNVEDVNIKYNIGWMMIATVLANILINNVIVFIESLKVLQQFVKDMKEKYCNKSRVKKEAVVQLDNNASKYISQGSLFFRGESSLFVQSHISAPGAMLSETSVVVDRFSYGNEKVQDLEGNEIVERDIVEERKTNYMLRIGDIHERALQQDVDLHRPRRLKKKKKKLKRKRRNEEEITITEERKEINVSGGSGSNPSEENKSFPSDEFKNSGSSDY